MNRPSRRLAFRLCLAGVGGFSHPDFLLASMSSAQFAEWIAFALLEPFGERNRDLSMGMLGSFLGNVHRDKKKHPKFFVPNDFMPPSVESEYLKRKVVKDKGDSNVVLDIFKSIRDQLRSKRKKNA